MGRTNLLRILLAAGMFLSIAISAGTSLQKQGRSPNDRAAHDQIAPEALRKWLTYLSSDELEGRATFSEGLGLAAAYIAGELRAGGVQPGGDRGTYFQRVQVLGVRSLNRSTVTVEVNGQSRTFRDGEDVQFPKNVGGKRTFTLDQVHFVGYGLNLGPQHNDYSGVETRGHAVVWLGDRGPRSADPMSANRLIRSRASIATEEMGAAATIERMSEEAGNGSNRGRGGASTPDFSTVKKLDSHVIPNLKVSDAFLEFLFGESGTPYSELKEKGIAQDDLPRFPLKNVRLTFNLDADYQVVRTQYTRNVVGVVEGTDAVLKGTYVAFGAHYDHDGYAQGVMAEHADRISNGADDDGSGSAALVGMARAFAAAAPKTRRSLLFVWHAGEEIGLYGSEYFADYPTIPLDRIVAQLNMDMIGRNRDNKESEANTVYTVGSDRISTELHNLLVDANAAMPKPLRLDFEMNDPVDPERIYFRSDHYSYAAKGIPVIFFFTGLHPDYHQVTDTADKILFEKMSRVASLVYGLGRRLANLDRPPARDFKGPRIGRDASGKIVP